MSKLKQVIFEYEDKTFIAEGAEAEKWQSNFDQQIAWANVENNNYFRNNPVKFEIYPENPCCKIKMNGPDTVKEEQELTPDAIGAILNVVKKRPKTK